MDKVGQYSVIILKVLEKTQERKLDWEVDRSTFTCRLDESPGVYYIFAISQTDEENVCLRMKDNMNRTIFSVESTALPLTPIDERASQNLQELYELARRKALKVDEKVKAVSDLLDRT